MFRRSIHAYVLAIFVFYGHPPFSNAQGHVMDELKHSLPTNNLKSYCKEIYLSPTNNFCSIVYLLFTQGNKISPCYFEPKTEEFNDCDFDSRRETKILIHGFDVKLLPGNQFELIKDALLSTADYNVIIVNWTRYNQGNYEKVVLNVKTVGIEVSKLINFLVSEKGANNGDIHIIGHSLGAHVAGIAGKQVQNLGRITGIDPAGPLYETSLSNRLSFEDANFVDVLHCSNELSGEGVGLPFPIGYINFYPNGGNNQPACQFGRNYTTFDGEIMQVSVSNLAACRHDVCNLYFLYSIQCCDFLSRQCNSYRRYKLKMCLSKSHASSNMGFGQERSTHLLHIQSSS